MADLDCGLGQEGGQGSSSRSPALCPSDGARRLSLPRIQASQERIHRLVVVARDLDSELFAIESYAYINGSESLAIAISLGSLSIL